MGIALVDSGETDRARDTLLESLRRGQDLDEMQTSRVAIAGIARLFASARRLEEATSLFTLAERLGHDLAVHVPSSTSESRERLMVDLRSRMGDDSFEAARGLGESMDLEQALALATGDHSL